MNHIRRRAGVLVAVIGVLAVAGCGPSGGGAPQSSELPEGWERHEVEAAGFSLGLPDRWEPVDPESITEGGAFRDLVDENPELESVLLDVESQIESGVVDLFAFDLSPDVADIGFATNVNVIALGETSDSLNEIEDQAVSEIESAVDVKGEIAVDRANLPVGESVRVRYVWDLNRPDGEPLTVATTQYLIPTGGEGFVVTFSTTDDADEEYQPTFVQMANSFQAGD